MSDPAVEKPSTLSPAKQALLEQRWRKASQALAQRPEIPRRPHRDCAPLSFIQRQMWVIDQLTPGNPAYNLPYGYRLRGPLDVAALEKSCNEIIRRHEVLRTTFARKDGEPMQVIHPELKIKIKVTPLDHLPASKRESILHEKAGEESLAPFDLSRLPLIRVSLFKLGDTEHVLLINQHHIIADGLSIGPWFAELDTFYRAFIGGEAPRPSALAVQYGDFALWQQQAMAEGTDQSRQLEFWQNRLSGVLPVLELPGDRPRPALQSFRGSNVFFDLPAGPAEALKALGAREGCTFFMTVLAAFQVLLHRHSGAEDMVIGSPFSTRSHPDLGGLIGVFLNMVALRCDLAGDPSFLELLRRSRETTLDAFSHGDLPLEILMNHLKVERDPRRNPVFQVVLQVLSAPAPSLGDLEVSNFHFDLKFAQFDLTLHLYEEEGGYYGRLEYCSDLFDEPTIQRLCGHFLTLLDAVVREPHRKISALPLLTEPERHQLLVEWNQTATDYPRDACIHELFEAQARRTPRAVALELEGNLLTYGELNSRANQVAHFLARHGVGPEMTVGVCVERSFEMVVGILGILKAGAAYVPLDPDYPSARLDFMVKDTGARVLLTQARGRDRLPVESGRAIALDADWPQIALEDRENLETDLKSSDLAAVFYTSGSTGRPKGTGIAHHSVVRLVKSTNYLKVEPEDVFLQFAPISFDASTLELWGSLLHGAKLVLSPARPLSLQELGELIQDRGVTVLWLTAALFHQMVDEQIGSLRNVRQLLAGGEALSVSHVRRMIEALGENRLINGYGPTENTTFTCCHVMTAQSRVEHTVPIGRPISNTRVYVLDRHQQPVPIGVHGELYAGGDGLANGYLNQPELTAQKFVQDPFGAEAGRLYRTGDLVRYRPDGCLEFLGRVDHQVKIRGFRIEPDEIEFALREHPAVRDAVVVAREDVPGEKRLVAYLLWESGPLEHGELRAFLKEQLPVYMVPAAFVGLDRWPLTPNGKVDAKALPPPEVDRSDHALVAPQGDLELQLAEIWRAVLRQERIGATDSFFELGGHSLLAMQMFAQIERRLGVKLPLALSFQAQTIQQLAARIERETPTSGPNSLILMKTLENTARLPHPPARQPQIPKRPDRSSAPLSFAQRQMWVIDQMTPGNPAYNLWIGYRLRGRLNLKALEDSFNAVIKRHEALRTTFGVREGEPVQLIHPELKIPIKVTALDQLADAERERALQTKAAEESVESFDLSRLPLIRVALFKLSETEHVLILTIHHIVSDGLSTGLLLEELNTFYQAFLAGEVPRPRDLPVQYGDFALWQTRAITQKAYAEEVEFWRTQLGGRLPVLELAGDKPRPARQSFNGANVPFRLSPSLVRDLRMLGAKEKCSFFITVLAAFHTLLHRYSGAEDIVVGTPIGIRAQREVEPLIGNFLNMIALRCDLSGDPNFAELLRKSRDTTLAGFLNSELPFEAMMQHLKFERDPSRNPIFQVLLTVLPASDSQLGDVQISDFHTDVKVSQFDLSLHLYEEGDSYVGEFVYCTDLFHAATMERLTENFLTLLHAVIKDPQQRISKLPILAPSERELLLHQWAVNQAEFPADLLMHELFEAQAARTPDRTAVSAGATNLTYRELNARANQLAHALRSRGVGRGQRVGLCVERGTDMLAAVLGILKAGAAYVPLDPTYPQERLRFMAEDAQLALLISTTGLADDIALPRELQCLLDADADTITSMPVTPLPTDAATAQPTDPAYLIYTSGSTGKPKGVVVAHRGVVNMLSSLAREPGLTADDVWVAVTTLSFDIAVVDLNLPLMVGARTIIATRDEVVDGQALGALLDQQRATVLQATPVTWRLLMEAGWKPKTRFKGITGGEGLPKTLADQLLQAGIELWNLYGPTETTVYSTGTRVADTTHGITIGKPVANTIVRVLDPQKNLCPIGVPGELYIGGAGLALGYWNRPILTSERFIPDPFEPGGALLYRTGDLVRWRNDGNIEHLGRLDFQVKLRGFRIEVGEIEAGLAGHEAVREVAVVAREDTPGDKRLVAYLAAENPPHDLFDQLRARVRSAMPEYMVPAQFVLLPALPRTQNGKIDRKALPAPGAEDGARAREFVAPRTPTEEMVAGAFRTVLNQSKVGALDNFFDLGGNSLMAARLMFQLRTASGHDLPLRVLFERQTVSALAEAVDGLAWLADSKRKPGAGNRVEIEL